MTKMTIAFCIVIVMSVTSTFAQGEFLRPGESGFGIHGGLVYSEISDSYSFGFGYSLKGRVDFSFATSSDNVGDARSYAVSATYYVKHFHKQGMFGMGIMLGYGNLQGSRVRDVNVLILGAVAFNNIYVNRDFMLQPYLSGAVWRNSDAAVGSGQLGITAGLAHRAPVRPFIGVGIGSSDDQGYTIINGGLVAVF